MDVYVVLLRDDEGRDEHDSSFVRQAFPKARPLGTSGWILATELGSCDEVLKKLEVGGELERPHWSGLVVRLDDYSGYAEKSLWKTLGGWRNS